MICAVTVSCRVSARPSASKPGPRLALVAGARTVTAASVQRGPVTPGPAPRPRPPGSVVPTVAAGSFAIAVTMSGSFSPVPVIVHTTTEPRAICPAALACSSPATPAAEASSPNTASSRASRR